VSECLQECSDIDLFEQEAIQIIIDYKWKTYGRNFFLAKFFAYSIFLMFFYIDIESFGESTDEGLRVKGVQFILCKAFGFIIQGMFFSYELI